jgi:hypothetical protein
MGDSPSSDSGSNTVEVSRDDRMSPGRATAQFGAEIGSLAGGYTESQVQNEIDNSGTSLPGSNNIIPTSSSKLQNIAANAPVPVSGFSASANDREDTLGVLPQGTMSQIEQINVGPGDIFDLQSKIAQNLMQGGKASFDDQGNIIGATGTGPAFGGMSLLSGMLPDVTTYTGLNAGNPYGDPTMGSDNNEPEIIRRRMSAANAPIPVEEPTDPILSDELASDFMQNPYYLYSGINNQYQPYGYAQNTLVDLLRTRNMTQPQQRAANLGLFGNPGDFS